MKHWRAHQIHQSSKDLFALQLRGGQDGLQGRVAFSTPLRAEAVRHLAMNDAGAQGAFAHIVSGRDARIMQEGQQLVAVFGEARLPAQRPLPRDFLRQQVIQLVVQRRGLRHKFLQAERGVGAVKLMVQMNRRLEQFLRGAGPGVRRFRVQHAFEVAQLMRQTQLKDLRRSLELRAETIAHPDRHCGVAHNVVQHRRPATGREMMIDARRAAHHPLPPGLPLDARAGFITVDDGAGLDFGLDGRGHLRRRRPGARQDRVHAPLAEPHAGQVVQRLHHALIAQMRRLFEIHDGGFQARLKLSVGLQPRRQDAALAGLTVRANDFVLLGLNDDGRAHRQFTHLPPHDLGGRAVVQVGLTLLTLRDGRDDDLVGVLHQRPCVPFVPKRRAEFLGSRRRWQVLF